PGFDFDKDGTLLVALGNAAYKLDVRAKVGEPTPISLTEIESRALTGIVADPSLASANVNQVIELVGSGFGAATQVLFPTRDNDGVEGLAAVKPLIVNAEGSRLQVQVPALTTTGLLRVNNVNGHASLRQPGASVSDTI